MTLLSISDQLSGYLAKVHIDALADHLIPIKVEDRSCPGIDRAALVTDTSPVSVLRSGQPHLDQDVVITVAHRSRLDVEIREGCEQSFVQGTNVVVAGYLTTVTEAGDVVPR
jgi:hypothetical protein